VDGLGIGRDVCQYRLVTPTTLAIIIV